MSCFKENQIESDTNGQCFFKRFIKSPKRSMKAVKIIGTKISAMTSKIPNFKTKLKTMATTTPSGVQTTKCAKNFDQRMVLVFKGKLFKI